MSNGQQPQESVPPEIYGLFAGSIDQQAVQRFHNAISLATSAGVKHIHILFQCSGGLIGDGISLYNLFKVSPIHITAYNVGSICSVGVIAYLGAKHRKVSKFATFMIHRTYISPVMATNERLASAAGQMAIDDDRVEAILKAHANIPADKWELHKFADVWLSAKDSIAYGIAEDGEFSPPLGEKLFNVWPPQN